MIEDYDYQESLKTMNPMEINKLGGQEALLQDYYNRVLKKNYANYHEAQQVLSQNEHVIMENAGDEEEGAREADTQNFDEKPLVRDSLRNLDDVQNKAISELEFYNQQQAALQDKLRQQEELLALVQRDIEARENFISGTSQTGATVQEHQAQSASSPQKENISQN